jgi:iron-regulated transporter 1
VRALASILFSSSVGRWVDHSPDRLKTLLCTISINRTAVISASALWYFIVEPKNDSHARALAASEGSAALLRGAIFTLILALGILEGLSASGNMLSMERDWVVTAASPAGQPYDLTHLNPSMRRIDLICKLFAPILISVIVSATSIKIGVLVVGCMSAGSWAVEFWCARRVWLRNPRLRALKAVDISASASATAPQPGARNLLSRTAHGLRRYADDFRKYFSSTVWIPSLSLAFLHISALTYSATFITYLLAVGFSLDLITVARAAGSVVEISSTVVTPVGVSYLGKAKNHGCIHHDRARENEEASTALLEESPEEELQATTETGLERLGLWGISFQLINLVPPLPLPSQLSKSQLTSPTDPRRLRALVPLPSSNSTPPIIPSPYAPNHLPSPPRIHPLLLPLHLSPRSLGLRPHHPAAHANHDRPLPPFLFHRR